MLRLRVNLVLGLGFPFKFESTKRFQIRVDPPIQFPIDPYSTPIDPHSTPVDPYSTPFDAFSTKAIQIPIGKQLVRLAISTTVERADGRGKQSKRGKQGSSGAWAVKGTGQRGKGRGKGRRAWVAQANDWQSGERQRAQVAGLVDATIAKVINRLRAV